jgi:hypothetical protein
MKRLLLFALSILTLGMTGTLSFGQARSAASVTSERFIGAWRLASLEEPDAAGKVHKAECIGLLIFTRDGHMSVQVMYQKQEAKDSAAPVRYAQGGYEASFGRYEINDGHIFTFHVDGALVRTLIGKDLKRVYEFSGNQLIVKSHDPNEHWKVVWEHY